MRHENSVFHQIQKHVPWSEFSRLVARHQTDRRVRRLTSKQHFLALLFAQLSGSISLREITTGLESQSARLYHAGGRSVARSTLADANAHRSAVLFSDLFAHMAGSASRATRRRLRDAVRILDATHIGLSSLSSGWADMVKGHCAIKLHVTYDPFAGVPVAAQMSGQRVPDIVPAKTITPLAGVTYVFDLAYYDYAWWAQLQAAGCRFVSRLKHNTPLTASQPTCPRTEEQRELPDKTSADQTILGDRIGLLPPRMARSRKNPFADPVREIIVRISTGKILRLVTNDLEAPAGEIADLYKARWQIELFFRWIKQNLRIRHFLGRSENAVRIQIFVALIAYLLLRAAQATQNQIRQPLTFARLVRLNIMHRRPINTLKSPRQPPPIDQRQMSLDLNICQTGQ